MSSTSVGACRAVARARGMCQSSSWCCFLSWFKHPELTDQAKKRHPVSKFQQSSGHPLDLREVVFDQVTPLVDVSIVVSFPFPVRFGWNNHGCAALIKILQEPIGVESPVGQQRCEGDIVDQRSNPFMSCACPGRSRKRNRLPSASTKATILVVSPPRERPMA